MLAAHLTERGKEVSPDWVSKRLRFGRFLTIFNTTGIKDDYRLPRNLTERAFRKFWEATEATGDYRGSTTADPARHRRLIAGCSRYTGGMSTKGKDAGLICPTCKAASSRVVYTRRKSGTIRRLRACRCCKRRFLTTETIAGANQSTYAHNLTIRVTELAEVIRSGPFAELLRS